MSEIDTTRLAAWMDEAALPGKGEPIEARFLSTLRPMELLVPYAEGGSLSELHELAGELDREDTARGALIKARVPAGVASRFERFELNGRNGDE